MSVAESLGSIAWRRLKRDRLAMAGLAVLCTLYLVMLLAPLLAPYDPNAQAGDLVAGRYLSPSLTHWMGTDKFGRDVLSRLIYGSRISLTIGFVAVAIQVLLGTLIGAVAGTVGGAADALLMRFTDIVLSFPRLVLLILIVALFQPSIWTIVVVLGFTLWPTTARLVRAEALALRERPFIQAARALGAGRRRILFRHIIPNALGPVVVAATLGIGNTILIEAGLSFLGLGVRPPTPSWGNMIADGRGALLQAWWLAAFPGLAIVLTVMAVNLLGDGLRQAIDPRSSRAGKRSRLLRGVSPGAARNDESVLLCVRGLEISAVGEDGMISLVDDVNWNVRKGEILGVVGESGCGKSVTALSVMGLLPPSARVSSGSIEFDGNDLGAADRVTMQRIRGRKIAMIFQDPVAALDPVMRIGAQIEEALVSRDPMRGPRERARGAIDALRNVGIADPERRVSAWPHELSGGMAQRVGIAIALASGPRLLIADEPTTALDPTVQADILDLIEEIKRDSGLTVILVTHDLGIVAERADRVAVMYAGQTVEEAGVEELFRNPRHPYTRALLAATARIDRADVKLESIPGSVPSPADRPSGCRFRGRCEMEIARCVESPPNLEVGKSIVRCWRAGE